MDVRVLALVAVCWTGGVAAQQVHKCVDGDNTVYQSEPCATGQAAKTWDAPPDRANPERQARLAAIQDELAARKRAKAIQKAVPRGSQGAAISLYRDPARCEAARVRRAAAFEAAGMRRTYELTRRMDDLVFDACK